MNRRQGFLVWLDRDHRPGVIAFIILCVIYGTLTTPGGEDKVKECLDPAYLRENPHISYIVLLGSSMLLLFFVYETYSGWRAIDNENPSNPVPTSVHQELTQTKKYIDLLEELLQGYGTLIENTGTVCLQAFREIYKEQKAHLRQYNSFTEQYSEQFGFVVNILEGHRKDIEEASRAAKENNLSLCNIIGQYRQTIDENQGVVRQHIKSTHSALQSQRDLIKTNRELADARCDSMQNTLNSHTQVIEHNSKLIQEHGTSIDKVLSDHAELVAEYQTALDGLALLNAANHIISLIDKPSGWETLGGALQEVDDDVLVKGASLRLAQRREKLIKGPGSDAATASIIENVQELSRTFRNQSNAMIKAVHGETEGTGREPSRSNATSTGRYFPGLEQGGGNDQIMATMLSQVEATVKATVKATVDAQYVEEMKQLRKAQEDIEKLRADLAEIQKYRQTIRDWQELEKQNKRLDEIENIIKNDPERMNRDEVFAKEVKDFIREIREKNREM